MSVLPFWLSVVRGDVPLVLSIPHAGTDLCGLEPRLVSPWRARKDADWWVDRLYDFGAAMGATIIKTALSRVVIDVNRDPSGRSLYPGQATTELCPTTTFDGEPLYVDGDPSADEIAARRVQYFDPYHQALRAEIERLRQRHGRVIVYDCHSIRSVVPQLFEGTLPCFNIGTNAEASCDPALTRAVEAVCGATGFSVVVNGRFKGGYITRAYGNPAGGVHAIQMELACRSYMREPDGAVTEANWPVAYDSDFAAPVRKILADILHACMDFAQ